MNKIYLDSEFDKFWGKIENKENFTLLRFGDGERAIMCGEKVKAQEGWESPGYISELGKALLATLQINKENFFYGISCPCCDNKAYFWYLSRISNNKNITFANLWVNSNYKKFIENFTNLKRDAILIANYRAKNQKIGNLNILKHYEVDDDCISFWENNAQKMIEQIKQDFGNQNNLLYVVSAGPMSEPIITELYKSNPNNCYIDFGSSIDKFIHDKQTRPYMDESTLYAKQNCYMYNPYTTNCDVSVVLTLYKRPEYLETQLKAIENQTLKPKEILLYQDGTGDTIKIPEHLKQRFNIIEISPENKGVWERFNFARKNAKSKYVCIFDDDTIPGSRWLENCMTEMLNQEGLYGAIGIVTKNQKYNADSIKRIGWESNNEETMHVDFAGHSWFLKKDWIDYLFKNTEELQKYKVCAEDMTLSMKLQQHGINTYIPKQPESEPELIGSIKGQELGDDKQSLFVNNGWTKMSEAFDRLVNQYGFKTIQEIDKKYYDYLIKYKPLRNNKKNKFIQQIISVKNEYSNGVKRKVIRIFGIKLKFSKSKILLCKTNEILTVIIPTLLKNRVILENLIESLANDSSVKEIIIINNSENNFSYNNKKVRTLNIGKNIYVNPAWNLGVKKSTTDLVAFINDDLNIPTNFCRNVIPYITQDVGLVGMDSSSIINVGNNVLEGKSNIKKIRLKQINKLSYNFGTIMFLNKKNFIPIPEALKIYYGDNWLIATMLEKNKKVYSIVGPKILHYGSMSSQLYSNVMANEEKEYLKYYALD